MDKQPNSRICFVCGIDNPTGLHGAPSACTCESTPTTRAAAWPGFGRGASIKVVPIICTGESTQLYWMSQPKFLYTLAFWLYD